MFLFSNAFKDQAFRANRGNEYFTRKNTEARNQDINLFLNPDSGLLNRLEIFRWRIEFPGYYLGQNYLNL